MHDTRTKIAQVKALRGLTNADLADQMGVDTSTASRLVSGRRRLSLKALGKIAVALDVRIEDLVNPSLSASDIVQPTVRPVASAGNVTLKVTLDAQTFRRLVEACSVGPYRLTPESLLARGADLAIEEVTAAKAGAGVGVVSVLSEVGGGRIRVVGGEAAR